MSDLKHLPLPYFLIDIEYNILAYSAASEEIFSVGKKFLELVDWESHKKIKNLFEHKESKAEGELNMKTKFSPYALFDISVNWHGDRGHVICIEKDHRLSELENIVEKHRIRLAETDLELLEKKEQVEKSLLEIKSLSCPFIKLTRTSALVPLFGDLDEKVIRQNEDRVLNQSQEGGYQEILFDLNGVGELTIEGVEAFISLVKEMQVMGLQPAIIGVKPHHAFFLNHSTAVPEVPYLNSLSKAFKISH
jgi:rsbT co-antagonist protein RsbR